MSNVLRTHIPIVRGGVFLTINPRPIVSHVAPRKLGEQKRVGCSVGDIRDATTPVPQDALLTLTAGCLAAACGAPIALPEGGVGTFWSQDTVVMERIRSLRATNVFPTS